MQQRRQFIQTEIAQFFLDYHEQKKGIAHRQKVRFRVPIGSNDLYPGLGLGR
jgi:hypothetical protein